MKGLCSIWCTIIITQCQQSCVRSTWVWLVGGLPRPDASGRVTCSPLLTHCSCPGREDQVEAEDEPRDVDLGEVLGGGTTRCHWEALRLRLESSPLSQQPGTKYCPFLHRHVFPTSTDSLHSHLSQENTLALLPWNSTDLYGIFSPLIPSAGSYQISPS